MEHSFTPSDRVFTHVKYIKKHSILLTDQDYIKIVQQHATFMTLGEGCPVYELKKTAFLSVKEPSNWHFKVSTFARG